MERVKCFLCGRRRATRRTLLLAVSLACSAALFLHAEVPRGSPAEAPDEGELITPSRITQMLESLQSAVGEVETPCRKMVRMGGKVSCVCETKECSLDGAKRVCLDDDVRPVPGRCLALGFGIGFEMTFDEAMVRYGCRVLALDPTNPNITDASHRAAIEGDVRRAAKGRTLHALNLGLSDRERTVVLNLTFDGVHFALNTAAYRTYGRVLAILDSPSVQVLKLDVEGDEWKVLRQVLLSPGAPELLRDVRQILLEVHFDFLNSQVDVESLTKWTELILGVLSRLRALGFHLAGSELNENAQKYFSFGSLVVPLYREIILIRRWP